MITVTLTRTSLTRRPCLFCGRHEDKVPVNANVLEEGERTGYVVCASCLGRERADLVATILAEAASKRADAAELEAIAANLPPLPTRAEWEKANEDAARESCADQGQTEWFTAGKGAMF